MTAAAAKKIWLNGEILATHEARIAPDDRGFLLADGVFETALMQMGVVYWLADHMARLRDGAAVMGIDLPAILHLAQHGDVMQNLEKLWRGQWVSQSRGLTHNPHARGEPSAGHLAAEPAQYANFDDVLIPPCPSASCPNDINRGAIDAAQ